MGIVVPLDSALVERISAVVDATADEIVAFTADLIRIPTVNPPGEEYETCARFIGEALTRFDFDVHYVAAEGHPDHTAAHPRVGAGL